MTGELLWRCGCGHVVVIGDRRVGKHTVDKSRVDRIVDRLRAGHVLPEADKQLFTHFSNGSGRIQPGGFLCTM